MCTALFTFSASHATHYTPHCKLNFFYSIHCESQFPGLTLHSTFTPHSLPSTISTVHFTIPTTHFTPYNPQCTIDISHSTLYIYLFHTPHSTLHTPHSSLHMLHSSLHNILCTLHTSHFTHYISECILQTHSTLYSTLHSTPHSTLHSTS